MSEFKHIPIMLSECMEGLNIKNDGIYFDGTLGGGGHSAEILKLSAPTGRLIATDLDTDAISAAEKKLNCYEGRYTLVNDNYKNYDYILSNLGIDKLDGVLLDFGVSSYQLDERERGFSYLAKDVVLDMRMDRKQSLTAKEIVNSYSREELLKILYDYGEEKFAANIVKNIIIARDIKEIVTTGDLTDIIEKSIPKKFQQNGPPARKTFQALRIEVNGELDGLYDCVLGLSRRLKPGGRIAILTFHSLEDRIVKQAFKYLNIDCICPKTLPICVCGKKSELKLITKKPKTANEDEILINSRSKSAKLRIAEKI
jgi:16S rRNA (cytosine1402-N4)-methyltransferase